MKCTLLAGVIALMPLAAHADCGGAYPVATFTIQSGSMLPSLAYQSTVMGECYRHPVGVPEVHSGDVAVFLLPNDPTVSWVKRIVGMPGDTIQMKDGHLYINGSELERDPDGDFTAAGDGPPMVLKRYDETLPDGVAYKILKASDDGPLDNTQVYRVPPGHVFVMGDNRDDSLDSRVLDEVGFVPLNNLVARVLGAP